MKFIYLVLTIVVLTSCIEKVERKAIEFPDEGEREEERASMRTQIPEHFLELKSPAKYIPSDDLLFGRFFNDRAEFFIIDEPLNKVFESDVKSVTLCYLDDLLSKTTFVIEENIAEKLMANYGNFRLAGHDIKNRGIIESGDIWEEKGKKLNSGLNNYRMAWTLGEQEIWFRVDERKSDPYIYIEMTDQYHKMLRMIERTY